MSYCSAVRSGTLGPEHVRYHDHEYGFPLRDDEGLFERLVLEINQAGLSWTTILRKKDGFRRAYIPSSAPTSDRCTTPWTAYHPRATPA